MAESMDGMRQAIEEAVAVLNHALETGAGYLTDPEVQALNRAAEAAAAAISEAGCRDIAELDRQDTNRMDAALHEVDEAETASCENMEGPLAPDRAYESREGAPLTRDQAYESREGGTMTEKAAGESLIEALLGAVVDQHTANIGMQMLINGATQSIAGGFGSGGGQSGG